MADLSTNGAREADVKHILLIGAGFSRNWGGWLASEVNDFLFGLPEMQSDAQVRSSLVRSLSAGGFEAALSELQNAYKLNPTQDNLASMRIMEGGIIKMFAEMERGFAGRYFDFCNDIKFKVSHFLARFDAIFSLNQDLLLDRHYHQSDVALAPNPRKWNGWERPGIRTYPGAQLSRMPTVDEMRWQPLPQPFNCNVGSQPYFKLHGSWDWVTETGEQILIMGGNKLAEIQRHPLLNWYQEEFERYLAEANSRLMVIGYSFADKHINETVIKAAAQNPTLSLFIVHPRGRASVPPELNHLPSVGNSARLLSETFNGDEAELRKLYRFFEP